MKTNLTHKEMFTRFTHRVEKLYGMSVKEYLAARRNGTLPRLPGSIALEVFSGEAAQTLRRSGCNRR